MVKNKQINWDKISDAKIVEFALEGNQKAFSKLLEKYQNKIFYLLLDRVGNENDAEDLTMETFGNAFNNIKQYTNIYAFSTWLFRIAINKCTDFQRKRKDKPYSYEINSENTSELVSEIPTPEEIVIKAEKSKHLKDIIKTLKPRYSQLIELYYYEELSYGEIAQRLNRPIGSIKGELFRAKELLESLSK